MSVVRGKKAKDNDGSGKNGRRNKRVSSDTAQLWI